MAYRIEYARGVEKDLRHLPQEIKEKALAIIRQKLALDPYVGVLLKGRYYGLWKYRISDYRIIYSIEKQHVVIFILRIRHRKEVYRGIVG